MNKIVHVGSYDGKAVYCRIRTELKDCTLLDGSRDTVEVLSITGVVGPKSNGDAYEAGQCADTVRQCTPGTGWTTGMVQKLCDIWQRWHLNDMRPYCEHQREWRGDKLLTLYEYRMSDETRRQQTKLKGTVERMLLAGESVQLSEDECGLYSAKYFLNGWSETPPEGYEPYKTEQKPARSVYPLESDSKWGDKHPEGILTKACPVCGYKWGTQWRAERIPDDVLQWLEQLPDTDRRPAWV